MQTATEDRGGTRWSTAARIVLGVIFTVAGISGFVFLFATPPPPPPGIAGAFMELFFRSHWVQFVDGVELLAGVLLLANWYVALALVALIAVIANIFWFHLTMQPIGLPAPLILLALWIVVARRHRAALLPLLTK